MKSIFYGNVSEKRVGQLKNPTASYGVSARWCGSSFSSTANAIGAVDPLIDAGTPVVSRNSQSEGDRNQQDECGYSLGEKLGPLVSPT